MLIQVFSPLLLSLSIALICSAKSFNFLFNFFISTGFRLSSFAYTESTEVLAAILAPLVLYHIRSTCHPSYKNSHKLSRLVLVNFWTSEVIPKSEGLKLLQDFRHIGNYLAINFHYIFLFLI